MICHDSCEVVASCGWTSVFLCLPGWEKNPRAVRFLLLLLLYVAPLQQQTGLRKDLSRRRGPPVKGEMSVLPPPSSSDSGLLSGRPRSSDGGRRLMLINTATVNTA